MFTFCPLQGALSESTASQSLLELDGGVKVLIDVGWDDSFDVGKLRELEKQIPTLSLILLTHATVPHVAAYAHCCKHFPLFTRIPVYATRPVIDLGRTLTQDFYASTPLSATTIPGTSLAEVSYTYAQAASASDFNNFLLQAPTPEEIARYFSLIQPLKYSQSHQPLPSPFSPPLNGLTITAYNSGHTLGGAIWHIQHGLESIVYAVDWNQTRENVLAGAAWLGGEHGGAEVIEQLRKPTALVCSSRTPEVALTRARRDEQLLESLKLCVARGGTVLIPVDSSSRVLELAYLLERTWRAEFESKDQQSVLRSTKLYLAGRNVSSTIKNARSMLEWMDDNMVRELEAFADQAGAGSARHAAPFDFKHLRLLERRAQIEHILRQGVEAHDPQAQVILASDASLEWGFSKDVLKWIANDARNLVILTEKPGVSQADRLSVSRTLWNWWKERRDGVAIEQTSSGENFEQVYSGGKELEMLEYQRRALDGQELEVYQQWLATQRQLHATLQTSGVTSLESSADVVDDASSDSSESDESDNEQQGKALNVSTTMGQAIRKKVVLKDEDLGIMILHKKKGVYDFDVRGKKGRERVFPFLLAIRRKRHDEYGELIRPEDYLRAEEREDADGQDVAQAGQEQQWLGKKRKWDDIGAVSKERGGHQKRPLYRSKISDATHDKQCSGDERHDDELLDALEDEDEIVMGPSKLEVTRCTIKVNMRIAFVDFSGLHDRRSLNMLIPLIQPRKLVLVAGNEEETLALAADCRKLLRTQLGSADERHNAADVLTPAAGVQVDASVDTNAWAVRLADPLVKRLKWQKVRGLGIVTVTGLLVRQDGADGAGPTDPSDGGQNSAKKGLQATDSFSGSTAVVPAASPDTQPRPLPILDVLPSSLAAATRSAAQPLHVGDLRLADLRKAMLNAGHTAEFRGEGTLLIDGTVAVRKTTTGRIELESIDLPVRSAFGGTFYEVKRRIYEGLAVVAGA